MHTQSPTYGSRKEVFAGMRRRGARKAIVHFSSGDGRAVLGPIQLHDDDGQDVYTCHDPVLRAASDDEGLFVWALVRPALDDVKGFPEDCDANGTVEWRSDTETVEITGEKTVAVTYSFSEEV